MRLIRLLCVHDGRTLQTVVFATKNLSNIGIYILRTGSYSGQTKSTFTIVNKRGEEAQMSQIRIYRQIMIVSLVLLTLDKSNRLKLSFYILVARISKHQERIIKKSPEF